MSSTEQRTGRVPEVVDDRISDGAGRAAEMVEAADALAPPELWSADWPDDSAVTAFLQTDRFERILGLYCRAIRLDPAEPAYPWNLASLMGRLGFDDLAVAYLGRAIAVAVEVGDQQWSDAAAHLAWADAALRAGQHSIAAVALAGARRSSPTPATLRTLERLTTDLDKSYPGASAHAADLVDALEAPAGVHGATPGPPSREQGPGSRP